MKIKISTLKGAGEVVEEKENSEVSKGQTKVGAVTLQVAEWAK